MSDLLLSRTLRVGAAGAVVEQEFRLFATAFYNGPVDPSHSVTRQAP